MPIAKAVFDKHMPGPNQIARQRQDVHVTAADLLATGAPVVLAGDYNVVPTGQDIYPTTSYDKDALLQKMTAADQERVESLLRSMGVLP